ncbi:MAG: thioredoxin family protein, partial [Bacteroidales bacterium]|nr:thioredoxin family protein [Bacteroidales bacterium]
EEIEKKKPDFEARRNDVVEILENLNSAFGPYIDMHKTPSKYTLIVFWEPDCSHCKEEIPKLFKFYNDTLSTMGVKVWAVYMNRSVDKLGDLHRHINKWFDFVNEKKLFANGWINCWNPFDQYRENFDVNSTPTFYLLDDKKEIIAKRISHEQVYEIINMIEEEKAKRGEK